MPPPQTGCGLKKADNGCGLEGPRPTWGTTRCAGIGEVIITPRRLGVKIEGRGCGYLMNHPVLVAREVSGQVPPQRWGFAWTGHAFTRGYGGCVSRMFLVARSDRS